MIIYGEYMEVVQDTKNSIDVFESDIELYISLWCDTQNISVSDIVTISQNRYNSLLYYLYRHIFKDADLKRKDMIYSGVLNTNNNGYNIPLLEEICNTYIDLCDRFDKIVNVEGFCRLIGIDRETIYEWSRDSDKKASRRTSDIAKRLTAERERTLADRLASGVKNPVGVLGCLNHWHNWAGVGNMEERKPQQISLQDVRKQAQLLSDNSGSTTPMIAEKVENKLSDN